MSVGQKFQFDFCTSIFAEWLHLFAPPKIDVCFLRPAMAARTASMFAVWPWGPRPPAMKVSSFFGVRKAWDLKNDSVSQVFCAIERKFALGRWMVNRVLVVHAQPSQNEDLCS